MNGSATQAPDVFRSFMQRSHHARFPRRQGYGANAARIPQRQIRFSDAQREPRTIAKVLGFQDWNVLSARIQPESQLPGGEATRATAASHPPGTRPQSGVDDPGKDVPEEIVVNAATLDAYVGFYQLTDQAIFTVTRDENHLAARMTGQRAIPIYAQSKTEFFAKVVAARISFITDAKGQAASLVLHQGGHSRPMKRIDAATARRIESEIAEKVRTQSASPGTEAALHRLIDGLASGKPNYQEMSPVLAEATRQQLKNLHASHEELGAVQSVRFLGVS